MLVVLVHIQCSQAISSLIDGNLALTCCVYGKSENALILINGIFSCSAVRFVSKTTMDVVKQLHSLGGSLFSLSPNILFIAQ